MLEQLIGELIGMFDWVTTQLGWEGSLGWFQILLLALAIVGALVIMRNLIGGSSGGGRGSGYSESMGYLPLGRHRGFPTRYYTGSERLGDFSIKKEVYDFKVPSPKFDLSKLRGPIKFDIEKARKLFFIPPVRGLSAQSRGEEMGRMPSSKGLSASRPDVEEVPQGSQEGQQVMGMAPLEEDRETGVSNAPKPAGPDWELARRLFVPKRYRLW